MVHNHHGPGRLRRVPGGGTGKVVSGGNVKNFDLLSTLSILQTWIMTSSINAAAGAWAFMALCDEGCLLYMRLYLTACVA